MGAALLVVDMQNGFCHERGSMPTRGVAIAGLDPLVGRVAAAIADARRDGLDVLFTRHGYRPGYVDCPPAIRSMLPTGALLRGTWDAEVLDALQPSADEVVIDKSRFDAFLHTQLEQVLRALGVHRLLIAGVLTNVCVETTARSAQQRDFDVVVLEDCTASGRPELHERSLAALREVFVATEPWASARSVGAPAPSLPPVVAAAPGAGA